MKWIEKCPHCGHTAHIQINVRNSYVSVELLCDGCDAIFKCSMHLNGSESIPDVVNECLTDVLERWNRRAKEPQERKESNIEWLLKNNENEMCFCECAYEVKHNGKSCIDIRDSVLGVCDFCEFKNTKTAIDYLLEIHEENE